MKKYIITALVLTTIFVPQYGFAQLTPEAAHKEKCKKLVGLSAEWYNAGCNKPYSEQSNAPTLYTVGGGGTIAINPVNTATQTDSFSAPQSGSEALKQCSAIKFKSLLDILIWIKCIIVAAIIPLLFALATLFFMWGVLQYIRTSDSTKRKEAEKRIWAGLVGLFVMVSLWGIIGIVGKTLGTGSTVPMLQTSTLK